MVALLLLLLLLLLCAVYSRSHCLLDFNNEVTALDVVAFSDVYRHDNAIMWCTNACLHLHGRQHN
jgi:hypothetical protein